MKCKQHPRYVAKRKPPKTVVHPDGCPTCWGVWEHAKTDPKRLVKVLNVELTPEEARVSVFALQSTLSTLARGVRMGSVVSQRGDRVSTAEQMHLSRPHMAALEHLYKLIAIAARDAL